MLKIKKLKKKYKSAHHHQKKKIKVKANPSKENTRIIRKYSSFKYIS